MPLSYAARAVIGAATLTLAAASPLLAQSPSIGSPATPRVARSRPDTVPAPQPSAAPASRPHRWIDLTTASADFRYRYIETSRDVRTNTQLQHKQRLRVGFKFDSEGRYSLQTFSGTSNSFSSTWDNTGLGTGEPGWPFAMRELYFSASPVSGISAQVGGFNQLKGLATEITAFDNDNYLVGYRGSVKRPADLYLDEVAVTVGFVGELADGNVFDRLDGLGRHNYTQVLASKTFSRWLAVSGDWESLDGISTLHQTVRVTTEEWKVLHGVRFEQYQRLEGSTGYGFALEAERALTRRVTASGGYAQIDRDHGPLNGDRYGRGKRLLATGSIALTPELNVEIFYTHAVKNDFALPNAQRFDIVASYNVLRALQRTGAW